MAYRIRWQQVTLFRNRAESIRRALRALTVDPASLLLDGQENAGQRSEGVVPPQSDVMLVVQIEADVAITAAALRNAANRLEKDLVALRSQVFPLTQVVPWPLAEEAPA